MKVLIVDDERHVREAVKMLVDWQALDFDVILEAENGAAAIEMVKEYRPEFIVTDMRMPVQGGVEFLAWLHENAPFSKKIAISGHDDFDLVRSTMKYGGMDYILKPIDQQQLLQAAMKARNSLEEEFKDREYSRQRNMQINRLKPVYWDKLFSNLIAEPRSYKSVQDVLDNEFGLPSTLAACQVALLNLETMDPAVSDKYRDNRDLLFFTLTNICNEFLYRDHGGFAFRYWNSDTEIVILYWAESGELAPILAEIIDALQWTLHARCDIGIGRRQSFPESLQQSYQEARMALRQRDLLHRTSWIHPYTPSGASDANSVHASDYAEKFRLTVVCGKTGEMETAIDGWIEDVKSRGSVTMEHMEMWQREFELLQTQWNKLLFDNNAGIEDGMLRPFPLPPVEKGRLSLPLWRQQLLDWMTRLSRSYVCYKQKEKNVIPEIVHYIEENYQKEITLQDIADHFYLSREHISRKFKQALGENLSDYLGKIRMDKARILLQNPALTICQIAEMTGYTDEKYFSKVFKKHVGVSPNHYRKSN